MMTRRHTYRIEGHDGEAPFDLIAANEHEAAMRATVRLYGQVLRVDRIGQPEPRRWIFQALPPPGQGDASMGKPFTVRLAGAGGQT